MEKIWKKRIQLCTVSGNLNWYHCYGNQYGGSSETKNRTTYDISILQWVYTLNWNEITILSENILTPIFTAASFTIFKIANTLPIICYKMDKFVENYAASVLSDTEKKNLWDITLSVKIYKYTLN